MQHTATHCNTLQHTGAAVRRTCDMNATHCNTLQHTTTHCNTLRYTATHCNTLQHTATHCNTLQLTATHRNAPQRTATHCKTHRSYSALLWQRQTEYAISSDASSASEKGFVCWTKKNQKSQWLRQETVCDFV